MSDFDSIENLISGQNTGDETPQGKFAQKQEEIKIKEIEKITETNANSLGLPFINLFGFPVSPEAIALIDEKEAKKLKTLCFFYDGEHIRIGVVASGPAQQELADRLNKLYFCDVKIYLISENSFKYALEIYKSIPKVKASQRGVDITEESLEKYKLEISSYKYLEEKINQVNISDIITLVLATALKVDASDVHIEAEEKIVAVRLRIDGVLQDAAKIDHKQWKMIIARLKILAKVKINVEDKPQDGRFTINISNGKIEVRCSFLPTAFGESVVLRLLKPSEAGLSFTELGLLPQVYQILEKEIAKPNGLILTTGPTGAGKTTTLYSILNQLNKPGTKIITLEDPIEYQLEGVNQSQIEPSRGYGFAEGLRSILRQDPNIVMVGEIRDQETAEIAIQASLTGHLVVSTLHTNDASGVIPRLIDMGVKPYFLVPSINAVIGQRLVRKLCPQCKKEHLLTEEEADQVNKILAVISPKSGINIPPELPKFFEAGPGCDYCSQIGYKGRIGIFELFTLDEKIKQLTIDKAPSFKILQQAIENGMITMLQDGILKAMDGRTSLSEIYRVIGNFDYINELYDIVISQTMGRGIKISAAEMNQAKELGRNIKGVKEAATELPSQKILGFIISMAITGNAGDIHIEPAETEVKVRLRIDGVMTDLIDIPKSSYIPLLSEVKLLAGFATNEKKATMDGRFVIYLPENKKADCRLSIISGGYGETIVIRLLSNSAASLSMENLGITTYSLTAFKKALKKTKGVIITTGPTGSGKTTTLYSALNALNQPDVKIITVEDPIEYQLPGVIQTQIDTEKGYTFAAAMRSLLRQNPNIMMIGEIRDHETAEIAVEASMTGHLVLSTIHANSAAGAISRFAGLDIDRSALANSIEFSIGQRLVRRICPHCKKIVQPEDDLLVQAKKALEEIQNKEVKIPTDLVFYEGGGCPKCGGLGYKGRLGLYETIEVTPEIQKLIQNPNSTNHDIEELAEKNGTVTMLQDGVLKALAGETSLKEVFRVI
ncbi:MAG: GspE/PulE family protein [Candidatus Falkowbacteria bacterium]|nr:GspE/PulE family protein [Candidatus Falkowbacteria bacterium]